MIFFPRSGEENRIVLGWIERRVPDAAPLADAQAVAVIRGGRIAAAAAFNNYRAGASIELTFAADTPGWASRDAVSAILAYPFKQLKVRRLGAITRTDNQRARRLLEGLGFMREGTLHAAFAEGNGAMYGMTRRWFERSKWHGKEHAERTAAA